MPIARVVLPPAHPSDARMNVVIVGVTGFRNRGVEALVRPVVNHLLSNYASAHVTIATWSPEFDALRIAHPRVHFVKDEFLATDRWGSVAGPSRGRSPLRVRLDRFIGRQFASLFSPRLAGMDDVMPFDVPDLLLVSGGDIYSSDYGVASLRHFVEPVLWARRHHVPCVLLGHSIGRFRSLLDTALWRQVEDNATVITLRESLSRGYLINEMHSPPERLEVTADMAFLLDPQQAADSRPPEPTSGPTVAVAVSAGICQWTGQDPQRHADAWASVLRMIIDEWSAEVVMVPHVQERFADDRITAASVMERLHGDHRVRLITDDVNAAECKWIISKCDVVLAERMHAAIAGLSSGVATVPIGYSIKAQGILGSVLDSSGIPPDELGMTLAEFLDVRNAMPKLRRIWHERARYAAALAGTIDRSKRAARRNLEIIDSLLRSQRSS